MTQRGILVTGWTRGRRVVGKVFFHDPFFLDDPHPEHKEIEWESYHEDHPGTHDERQSD